MRVNIGPHLSERPFVIVRRFLALVLPLLFGLAASPIEAAWTASGTFLYQDREFDENGFTGATPNLPIRFAKVEVRYFKPSGGTTLLATGATDAAGNYSILVNDTSTRDITIRALTVSGVANLFLEVTNVVGTVSNYAVATPTYIAHAPVNLNAGIVTAAIGAGGEPFNLFDVGLNTADYLAHLNGSRPNSSQELVIEWENLSGVTVNSYIGNNTIRAADNSGYNDTVIQHESGHYAVFNFSATDSPFGFHRLTNCKQDLRLAFDEGFATYFGQSVRRYLNLPNPHLYVKTTGAVGPGNLDFYFNVEDEVPYTCSESTSEVTIYAALWDLVDGATIPDETPGVDEGWDPLAVSDTVVWDIMRNYIPGALNKSAEDFWDGWFVLGKGLDSSFRTVFVHHGMEFINDIAENNDTTAGALAIAPDGVPVHATYFRPLPSGAGTTDVDYFKFFGTAGQDFRIETTALTGDANTSLVLLAPDGVTPIMSNDDRGGGEKSSLMFFNSPASATYYVKSFHGPGLGIYGSYDMVISGAVVAGGSSPPPVTQSPKFTRRPMLNEGDSPKVSGLSSQD
jgi:hypothetical protein